MIHDLTIDLLYKSQHLKKVATETMMILFNRKKLAQLSFSDRLTSACKVVVRHYITSFADPTGVIVFSM